MLTNLAYGLQLVANHCPEPDDRDWIEEWYDECAKWDSRSNNVVRCWKDMSQSKKLLRNWREIMAQYILWHAHKICSPLVTGTPNQVCSANFVVTD